MARLVSQLFPPRKHGSEVNGMNISGHNINPLSLLLQDDGSPTDAATAVLMVPMGTSEDKVVESSQPLPVPVLALSISEPPEAPASTPPSTRRRRRDTVKEPRTIVKARTSRTKTHKPKEPTTTSFDIVQSPPPKEAQVVPTSSKMVTITRTLRMDEIIADVGTSTTIVSINGCEALREPTAVLFDRKTGLYEFGSTALKSKDSTNENQVFLAPMQNGTVQDSEVLGEYLKWIVSRAEKTYNVRRIGGRVRWPRVIVGVHTNIAKDHKRNIVSCFKQHLKAGDVYVVDQAIAAAIGAGADVLSAEGCIVVDGGAGTTLIAVIASKAFVPNGFIYLTIGGNMFDADIQNLVRREFNGMEIGITKATHLKEIMGTATEPTGRYAEEFVEVKGIHSIQPIKFTRTHGFRALNLHLDELTDNIRRTINKLQAGQADMLHETGCWITGGLAQLDRIRDRVRKDLNGIPTQTAENPLFAVMRGLKEVAISESLRKYVAEKL